MFEPALQLLRVLLGQDALALVNKAKGNFIPTALWILKAYDKRIADSITPPIWWARKDAAWLKLTSDDLREIDQAASEITVQGARYPENLERMTGR